MADENGDQPREPIDDRNHEVAEIDEPVQHLMEEDYSDEVSDDYSEEDDLDFGYEDESQDDDEDEDEDEEEGLTNDDSENGAETPSEEDEGLNRGEIDGLFCPICMEPWTNGGDHQVCCLPCGHIYGLSCIQTWIQRNRGSRKCPLCKQKCSLKDVRVLYASRIVAVDEELQKKVQSLEAKCASLKKKNMKSHRAALGLKDYVHQAFELLRESRRQAIEAQQTQRAIIDDMVKKQAMFEKVIESLVASGKIPPFSVPW